MLFRSNASVAVSWTIQPVGARLIELADAQDYAAQPASILLTPAAPSITAGQILGDRSFEFNEPYLINFAITPQGGLASSTYRVIADIAKLRYTICNDEAEFEDGGLVLWDFDQATLPGREAYDFTKEPSYIASDKLNASNFSHPYEPAATQYSLVFDGSTDARVNYVAGQLARPLPDDQLTIEFWMNPMGATRFSHPIAIGGGHSATVYIYSDPNNPDDPSNGNIAYKFANLGGRRVEYTFAKYNADNNPAWKGWQHIAITYDGQRVRAYRNGELVYTDPPLGQPPRSGPINYADDSFIIGSDGRTSTNGFYGFIDEVRIWKRALSETDLQNHMLIALPDDAVASES